MTCQFSLSEDDIKLNVVLIYPCHICQIDKSKTLKMPLKMQKIIINSPQLILRELLKVCRFLILLSNMLQVFKVIFM